MTDTYELPPDEKIAEIAEQVETEWEMGGLAGGLYEDFAAEVGKRYALLAVQRERERCAKVAARWKVKSPNNWNEVGQTTTAEAIAAAIRKGE